MSVPGEVLFVEMTADGTVPQVVKLTSQRPTIMGTWAADPDTMKEIRADLPDGLTYYCWMVPWPRNEEGERSHRQYVEIEWTDSEGFSVSLHENALVAAASLAYGWDDWPYRMVYLKGPEDAGANLCAWGGPGCEFDITGLLVEGDPSVFAHVYERLVS
jgi:hypothetical protein